MLGVIMHNIEMNRIGKHVLTILIADGKDEILKQTEFLEMLTKCEVFD